MILRVTDVSFGKQKKCKEGSSRCPSSCSLEMVVVTTACFLSSTFYAYFCKTGSCLPVISAYENGFKDFSLISEASLGGSGLKQQGLLKIPWWNHGAPQGSE